MKNQIIETARTVKISDIAFCSAEEYRKSIKTKQSVFCSSKKTESLEFAKSIIVCIFSYYNANRRGNISAYAQGKDYHIVAAQKMGYIKELLEKSGYRAQAYADTGTLNERTLAELSGVAFRGKNHMMISEKYGSYFFIGYILTDCELEADAPMNKSCAECGRCIKACPTGVLGKKDFDETDCLSYITQKKGELTKHEEALIRKTGCIWGCDVCQEVCPHNNGIEITDIDEFKEDLIVDLKIDEEISNREFKKMYANRAFSWRGKGVLIRNQKIVEKN